MAQMNTIRLQIWVLASLLAVGSAIGTTAAGSNVTEEYLYRPVQSGIEIRNGEQRFNRPLYSSVERKRRLIAVAGDRPEFMLMQISATKRMQKLANLKLGLADGPWLDMITPVLSRYDMGLQHYRLGEEDAGVEIDVVRAIGFEGLLLRVKCHRESTGPLVLAIGGRGTNNYDQNPRAAAFCPQECGGTESAFAENILTLSGKGATVFATGSVPLNFTAADPNAVENGPKALLDAPAAKDAVAALSAKWPENGELYFILTTDQPTSKGVQAYRTDPAKVFAEEVERNRKLATAVEIDTPDSYLNAALPAALLAFNAAWNEPTFRHGAIAWHDSYAGWRVTYGATTAGWHDRAQSHVNAFFDRQDEKGRIPAKLERDEIYNMGEVLVDQALYDYEWTGNLDPLREGGFDAIARHLAWGEKYVKTPDGLYENFLNAWNTDYKWCNGGGGTIASTYYWRANKTMAEIAVRLGRDPAVFQRRADEIATAMKSRLWSERTGVYGEYRDRLGLKLLHESPDLSSIYTPIDLGFCDPFESYRMLRFALRRFETIQGLPREGALLYSSEWLPDHYSTRGIYTAEIINTILALYQTGQVEAAEPLRRAMDGSFFAGPVPGATGYVINPDGTFSPHTDFTDTTSMYIRTVVEGLFGVRMVRPEKRIVLSPSFPREWDKASIRCSAVEYKYTWDGRAEVMSVVTSTELSPHIRLRARRAAIQAVTVNGKPAKYRIVPGIGHALVEVEAPSATSTRLKVVYGKEKLPRATVTDTGDAANRPLTVQVDCGRIQEIRHGSHKIENPSISADGGTCRILQPSEPGVATFFVKVTHHDAQLWLPLEVDIPAPASPESPPTALATLQPKPVDLTPYRNQRLEELHKNNYEPRIKPFYWAGKSGLRTVLPAGRIWWETHGRGAVPVDTSRLTSAKGRFVSDGGIPFAVPATGKDAVFTSLYDNFPDRVEIPVRMRARKICFLLAASITLAQSRMENARVTVVLGDGTKRVLALRDPETIDDWLGSGTKKPYVLSGRPQKLGEGTHAVLQELDLGKDVDIKSVVLETRTNETMVGLLGITVMQERESVP